MLGGRPRGEAAFDRLCEAALQLLQTMPDTTATRELLARPPGSFQSEEQRRLLTDAATAWEAAEEGLLAAVGKLLAPLLRARADAELRPSVGEAALSLINAGLPPPSWDARPRRGVAEVRLFCRRPVEFKTQGTKCTRGPPPDHPATTQSTNTVWHCRATLSHPPQRATQACGQSWRATAGRC